MLKEIPAIISPELMKVMMEMGHGDELVIADGNFPAASLAQRLLRADGHGVSELLAAIMRFFPLDMLVERPVALMAVVGRGATQPQIWGEYRTIIQRTEPNFADWELLDRAAFYQRATQAYAVLATSEKAIYANLILKKVVVTE